jgi:hypothetical protein
MLEELRLNPRSQAERFKGRYPGQSAATEDGTVDPRLSTGFADGARLRSTGPAGLIHGRVGAKKEEVG